MSIQAQDLMNLHPLDVDELQRLEEEAEYKRLADDTIKLVEIQKELNKYIGDDTEKLETIEDNIDGTNEVVEESTKQLESARKHKVKGMLWKATGIGVAVGICVGGPLGGILGAQIGFTVAGAICGGIALAGAGGGTGYGIIKKKSKNSED